MRQALFVALVLGCPLRAAWSDVKPGQDANAVVQAVGVPLIQSKSRSGEQETWTYDQRGYVMFVNGRVTYWQSPQPKKPVKPRVAVPTKVKPPQPNVSVPADERIAAVR